MGKIREIRTFFRDEWGSKILLLTLLGTALWILILTALNEWEATKDRSHYTITTCYNVIFSILTASILASGIIHDFWHGGFKKILAAFGDPWVQWLSPFTFLLALTTSFFLAGDFGKSGAIIHAYFWLFHWHHWHQAALALKAIAPVFRHLASDDPERGCARYGSTMLKWSKACFGISLFSATIASLFPGQASYSFAVITGIMGTFFLVLSKLLRSKEVTRKWFLRTIMVCFIVILGIFTSSSFGTMRDFGERKIPSNAIFFERPPQTTNP